MKIFLTSLTLIVACQFIFAVPMTVAAESTGIAQLAQCSGADCSTCNVVYMANGLISWLIGITFMIFALICSIAGVRLVMSGGNSHAVEEAKGSFINAIVGLIIILAAWLIVDTLMRGLVGGTGHSGEIATGVDSNGQVTGWLFWSDVQCQVQVAPDQEIPWKDTDNMLTANNIVNNPTVSSAGVYNPSSTISPDGGYAYQSGVQGQASQASPELQMLMNCMLSQLPGDVGEISAISEKAIADGSKTFEQCWAGGCAHTAGSCHYGNGYGVIGQSYAVDFGDENHASDLIGAAYACGAGYAGVHNGDHVHVSAAACAGN